MKKKHNLLLVSLLLVTCSFSACNSSESPADVAEKFTKAIAMGDIETAKMYMVEEAKPLLELAVSMGQMEIQQNFSFELLQESIDGELAVVTYKGSQDDEPGDINLRKVEGEWKVYIEK